MAEAGVEDGLYMPDISYLLYNDEGEDEVIGLPPAPPPAAPEYGDWLYILLPSYPW